VGIEAFAYLLFP